MLSVLPHGDQPATPAYEDIAAEYKPYARQRYEHELKAAYAAAREYLAGPRADFRYGSAPPDAPSSAVTAAPEPVKAAEIADVAEVEPSAIEVQSLQAWLGEVVGEDTSLAAALRSVGVNKPGQVLRLRPDELDRLLATQELANATSVLDKILIETRIRPLLVK